VSSKRALFDNAYIESKRELEKEMEYNARDSGCGFELNSMNAVKLNYVRTINEKLGIKNSFTVGQQFPKEQIDTLIEYLNAEKQNIHKTFGLKDQSTSKEPLDFKRALGLLQKMYSKWCGMKFSGVDKDKHTKQYNTYETSGEDLNVFTGISVYKYEKEEILMKEEEDKQKQMEERNARREQEIMQKKENMCKCGICKKCDCETPKYELMKKSNNLFCTNCDKWKCRCS